MLANIRARLRSKKIQILLIVAVCVLTYLPILRNGFVYDDTAFFLDWQTPRSFTNVQKFLEGDSPENHGGNYRPLRTFIYAAEYKLWGENPLGYHAQAILVNAGIAVLIYLVTASITGNALTAFICAILFGIHPAHTEAVSFATASMDTSGILLALASFYLQIKSKGPSNKLFYIALVFALMAFFIYEETLVLPVLMLLYYYCFGPKPQKKKPPIKNPGVFWYFGGVLYYLLMRSMLMRQQGERPNVYLGGSFLMTLLMTSKYFYQYIVLLIAPLHMSVFHSVSKGVDSFMISPTGIKSMAIIDWQNILSVLIVVGSGAALWFYRRRPIIFFSISWFYICMLPVLNFLPTHSIFAERYIFFASFGYVLLISHLLTRKVTWYTWIIFSVLFSWYLGATVLRNNEWQNSYSLWSEVAHNAPYSPVGWNNLGLDYERRGNLKQAFDYFQKSTTLEPAYPNGHSNLGRMYFQWHQYDKGISEFELAVKYDPYNLVTRTNLAKAKDQMLDLLMQRSAAAKPNAKEIQQAIGSERSYVTLGEYEKAMEVIQIALKKFPQTADLYNDAGVIYLSQKDYQHSIEYLLKAVKIRQTEPDYYLNLANAFIEVGERKKAVAALHLALQLKPDFTAAKDLLDSL